MGFDSEIWSLVKKGIIVCSPSRTYGLNISGAQQGVYVTSADTSVGAVDSVGSKVVHTATMSLAGGGCVGLQVEATPIGSLGTWAAGMYCKITQALNSIDGYICAAEFETIKTGTYTNRDWGVISLNAHNDIVGAQSNGAFVILHEYGTNKANILFHFANIASVTGSPTAIVADDADTAATHYIRCLLTNTPLWIMATTTAPA